MRYQITGASGQHERLRHNFHEISLGIITQKPLEGSFSDFALFGLNVNAWEPAGPIRCFELNLGCSFC
jgi:hypothetical protein